MREADGYSRAQTAVCRKKYLIFAPCIMREGVGAKLRGAGGLVFDPGIKYNIGMPYADPEARRKSKHAWYTANRTRLLIAAAARAAKPEVKAARRLHEATPAGKMTKRKHKARCTPTRPEPMICEVCANPSHNALCLDHCPMTGLFRGWLCHKCNVVLGLVADSPDVLRALAGYLEGAWRK